MNKTMGVNGLDFRCWDRWSGPRKPGWSRKPITLAKL